MPGDREGSTRCFLAIELPEDAQLDAQTFVAGIQNQYPSFRFINFLNWHLTLYFFGNLGQERVDQLKDTLPSVFAEIQPFTILLEDFGAFPTIQRPNILWIGVGGDLDSLSLLKQRLDEALERMRFPVEKRKFTPHITVARTKSNGRVSPFSPPQKFFASKAHIQVNHLTLFQSILSPNGAKYIPLDTFKLGISSSP